MAFSRAAGPEELEDVPAEAAVVAYANVREIMDSDFRERFRQFEPDTQERDEFQQKTGVNIDEDINSVVAVLTNVPQAGSQPQNSILILARGRFQQSQLEELALSHGGQVDNYNGKQLLIHRDDSGQTEMAIGFLEADLIALGGLDAIKRSIDARGGRNIVSTNADIMRQIGELDAANAWAVGRFDAIANSAHVPSEVQAYLPAIQWVQPATHINGGVSGVFKAEARDEEAAKNMRDVLNGFLALAKMQAYIEARTPDDGRFAAAFRRGKEPGGVIHAAFGAVRGVEAIEGTRAAAAAIADRRPPMAISRRRLEPIVESRYNPPQVAPVADFVFFYGTLMTPFNRPGRQRVDQKMTFTGRGRINAALFESGIYPSRHSHRMIGGSTAGLGG